MWICLFKKLLARNLQNKAMHSKSLYAFIVGLGATFLIDCWSIILKQLGVKTNGLVYVGRWIIYAKDGQFLHNTIIQSTPAKYELLIGWLVHYTIGITFAFLLIKLFDARWLASPSLLPPMFVAVLSMLIPIFLLQPAFGFGIAFGNMPNQAILLLRFLAIHAVYGFGLFLTAKAVQSTNLRVANHH